MISKNKIKLIRSLGTKKYRLQQRLFIAEGNKIVLDFLHAHAWKIEILFAKKEWISKLNSTERESIGEIHKVDYDDLKHISFLNTPHNVLALIRLPDETTPTQPDSFTLSLAFDNVQDPGNLGTIIRIADWFGIPDIFCSKGSVDVFNPKVIQATMGSIIRTQVHYTDLRETISNVQSQKMPVYGTFLKGTPVFKNILPPYGLIVFGNESKGISPMLEKMIQKKITIPSFPPGTATINSLNLSTATAIVCAEFRRQTMNYDQDDLKTPH